MIIVLRVTREAGVLYLWEYKMCLSKFNSNLTKLGFFLGVNV